MVFEDLRGIHIQVATRYNGEGEVQVPHNRWLDSSVPAALLRLQGLRLQGYYIPSEVIEHMRREVSNLRATIRNIRQPERRKQI
jgi:hypothetical protein